MDRRRQVEALGGLAIAVLVACGDYDLEPLDARRRVEDLQRPPQDGLARKRGVLLGQKASKAASAASGDDQSDTIWHGLLDITGPDAAHFGRLRATSGPAIARPIIVHCTRCL